MAARYGQYPLRNWHFNTPVPQSGPMSRAEREFWLELIMKGSFLPAAGPKEPTPAETPRAAAAGHRGA